MKIKGTCLKCGAVVKRETQHPEQWLINKPIWVRCPNNHVGGVIFEKQTNTTVIGSGYKPYIDKDKHKPETISEMILDPDKK